MPDTKQMQDILALARQSIANRFQWTTPVVPMITLQEKRGVFVSLHKKGELRGCIAISKVIKHSVIASSRWHKQHFS
jgi:AMMECR1 domain-containing protein